MFVSTLIFVPQLLGTDMGQKQPGCPPQASALVLGQSRAGTAQDTQPAQQVGPGALSSGLAVAQGVLRGFTPRRDYRLRERAWNGGACARKWAMGQRG